MSAGAGMAPLLRPRVGVRLSSQRAAQGPGPGDRQGVSCIFFFRRLRWLDRHVLCFAQKKDLLRFEGSTHAPGK